MKRGGKKSYFIFNLLSLKESSINIEYELILLRPTFVFIFKIQSVNISYKYCILLKNGTNILYKYMYILFGIDNDTIWKISNLLLLNSKLQILINLFLKFRSVPPSIQLYAKLEYIGFENTEITYKVLKL